jgi:hypothetical protein
MSHNQVRMTCFNLCFLLVIFLCIVALSHAYHYGLKVRGFDGWRHSQRASISSSSRNKKEIIAVKHKNQIHPQNDLIQLFASYDESPSGSAKESSSSNNNKPTSNIDLFAVGPRKPPKNTETEKKIEQLLSNLTTSSSTATTAVDYSGLIPASRGSQMELQAERLRLEAEKDQIAIDEARIDQEIVSCFIYDLGSRIRDSQVHLLDRNA